MWSVHRLTCWPDTTKRRGKNVGCLSSANCSSSDRESTGGRGNKLKPNLNPKLTPNTLRTLLQRTPTTTTGTYPKMINIEMELFRRNHRVERRKRMRSSFDDRHLCSAQMNDNNQ